MSNKIYENYEDIIDDFKEEILEYDSQIQSISEKMTVGNTGFKSTTLQGILQEIYSALSTNNLINEFKIITGTNIPEVYFTGNISTMTKDNDVDLSITVKINNFEWTGISNTKWQGNSSLAYDKKNFTIKLYENSTKENKQKFDFNNWGKQNKFVLKANYIDHSHSRNIISARIWSDIVASRSDYSTLPEELRNSPNNCAIDGFPVKVTINGVYQGLYTLNIPKDIWMFNMDENNVNHAVLCAELNNNGSTTVSDAKLACEFRAEAQINGSDWSLECPDILNSNIKTSFNNFINFAINSSDNQFKYGIEQYLDVQSAIDYYIYAYFGGFIDSLAKNLIMMTYDGTKWFASMYDMDSSWGLFFDGSKIVSEQIQCPEGYQETNSLLWQRIEKCFAKELKERYAELRNNILNVDYITGVLNNFMSIIGSELYAKDLEVYPNIPLSSLDHLQQITDFITARSTYVDSQINELVENDLSQVPVISLVLDKESLNLDIPDNIQNVDLTTINKYSGREIYNLTEASATDTSKILTDFIPIDYNKINVYMSDSANENTRFGYYSSKEDSNPKTVVKIKDNLNGYINNSTYPYIKLMSNDNFENEKLISIDKNYIESILEDMDLSSVDTSTSGDKFIPITVSKGDLVFCKPSKSGYWNAVGTANNNTSNEQNNNTANIIVAPINQNYETIYVKIHTSLLTSGGTLKYKILHSEDLKLNVLQNITATLSPSNATNQVVNWDVDNENVELVVDGLNCTVKAKLAGNSVITCTSLDTTNGTISDTCNVTIS